MPRKVVLENARILAGVFLLGSWLGGCALVLPQATSLRDAWPQDLPAHVELAQVPFFPQEEYQCGPAALATVLAYAGAKVTPEELVAQVYIPERQGSLQVEMLAAPRRHALVSYPLRPQLEDVLREVAGGTPVVVLHGYSVWPIKRWHYSVVVGFDRERGEVVLRSGTHERQTMPFAVLEYTWKDSQRWSMLVTPPQKIPPTAEENRYLDSIHAVARAGDLRTASIAYGTFLQKWPDNVAAAIGFGNALHSSGHFTLAEAVLRDAYNRHPESVALMNNLAQTLSDLGRNREALELADRALAKEDPLAPAVRETREGILRRMGPVR